MNSAGLIRSPFANKSISLVKIIGPNERQQLPQSRQSVSPAISLCNSCSSLSMRMSRCLFFANHFSQVGFLSATFIGSVEVSIFFLQKYTLLASLHTSIPVLFRIFVEEV
jgi:hypothetical protein